MPSESEESYRVHLKEYLERLLDERDRHTGARFLAAERAVELARNEMDKNLELARIEMSRRLGDLNELRQEVTDDRSRFVLQSVYNAEMSSREEWRQMVTERLATIESRSVTWITAIGVVGIAVNILISWKFGK